MSNIGQIALAQAVEPGHVKRGQRLSRRQQKNVFKFLSAPPVLEELLKDVFPVAVSHEVTNRFAFFVHLERAVDKMHLSDGGEPTSKERIPQDHIAKGRPFTRPILG